MAKPQIEVSTIKREIEQSLHLIGEKLKLDNIANRVSELSQKIEDPDLWNDTNKAQRLLREHSSLQNKLNEFHKMDKDFHEMIELLDLAREEKEEVLYIETCNSLSDLLKKAKEREIETLMDNETDKNSCFLEIHSGAGGTESNDWADMLRRMYVRWATLKGFTCNDVDEVKGTDVGIKSCCIKIEGLYAYGWTKTETGVHRLVRISPFDSQNRRHTTFASVSVLPAFEEDENPSSVKSVVLDPKDLQIETMRSSGAGGQHVNKTDSAVRITHIPTGIIVKSQSERSQFQNKMTALSLLKSRLHQIEMKRKSDKKIAIASALGDNEWGNQIRSYVLYPYKLVKDLRTNVEHHDPDRVLDGDLDAFLRGALSQNIQHPVQDIT